MTRIIVVLACAASAFTPPTHSRPPTQLAAGFGKATKSKDKAVQIKGAPKPMDKQWDNYFALKDADGEIREVWLTTPGGDKPLPLGFVAAKKDGSPKEAVALQKKLIMWCAEGLHPRLSPFLVGAADKRLLTACTELGVPAAAIIPELDVWTYERRSTRDGSRLCEKRGRCIRVSREKDGRLLKSPEWQFGCFERSNGRRPT